jgi:outer membrane protein assembly factor BamD (BamD/ComL family)
MFKKLLILILILAAVALACMPLWTSRMAEDAFARPDDPMAGEMLQKAIRMKVFMLSYGEAGRLAEKGVIYFPESPHLPMFLFIAAKSAEKERNPAAAIHWYRRFLELYPQHEWADQAKGYLEKLKGMSDTE